ncbi:FIVAR domain-containing protein [Anaerococcus provencensis]|uniref:FIVAR domain-containing protein n=1 Tax=Anaerococcus provencensis TaxID=938293 RepID=UPI0002FC0C8F|nr:FIVAR domain-containing protein [Anaerococcus provencensis]
MKNIKKVLPIALVVTFSFLGGVTSNSLDNVSYASQGELSYRNTISRFVREDSTFRESDAYKNANDGEKTVYRVSIGYAKELLENESTTEEQFKAAAQEVFEARNQIEDTTNPLEERGKLRVSLKLQMYPAKDLIYKSDVGEYNQKEYDNLSKAYAKALNVYNNDDATDAEIKEASVNLKDAADTFVKESNRKARIIDLENSIEKNKMQIQVAENLLKNYPKTVKNVAEKLKTMIKESKELIKESEIVLSELKK